MIQSRQVPDGVHSKCNKCGYECIDKKALEECFTCGTVIEAMVKLLYLNAEQVLKAHSGFVALGYSTNRVHVGIKIQEYIPEVRSVDQIPRSMFIPNPEVKSGYGTKRVS